MRRRHPSKGEHMSIPYLGQTRESYIEEKKESALYIAEQHCKHGHDITMWQYLLTWVQCEEIYGAHWDRLEAKSNDQPI